MINSIPRSRRRQIEVSDVRERVQKRLSAMRAEIKLPLQRIRYVSGLDILCIAAEAGLKGLRTHRDIKIEELQSLPEEIAVEDFVDEDDVQHIVWSNADDLETDIEMAADALNELRKAFCVAAYHHWERAVIEWWYDSNLTKNPPRSFNDIKAYAEQLGIPVDEDLGKVVALTNLIKHNNKDKWAKLRGVWPEIVPRERPGNVADWSGTVELTDNDLLDVFRAVQRSGPHRSGSLEDLPFSP
ncbi:hypothetical protein [Novacetimonas hansenii]|uniref:hypothetical protein n=1 Tax=Novacetimonas hansenii TaxID=436 RepID=UPI000789B03E|nr:hypothetical protein [Novacetimonas hansenii]WEQ58290.1 hypothetical protein LV563_10515 [Novacetimonas hansenii]CUW48566.1 hypothetical protein ATCC53582_02705 [Novacetimonas hansenii]